MDDGGAASVRAIMHWQYRTICRGNNSILHNLSDLLGPKTHDYISFFGLRAYGKLFDDGPVASSQVFSCTNSCINAPYPHINILSFISPSHLQKLPTIYHYSHHTSFVTAGVCAQ